MQRSLLSVSVSNIKKALQSMSYYRASKKLAYLGQRLSQIELDLGSGGPGREGSIGIDLHPQADVVWNLQRGIPLSSNSVATIYSDHFLEHLPLVDVFNVLCECYRVLTPGGKLRFTVPHIDPYIEAWIKSDFKYIASKISDVPPSQKHLYQTCFDRISWLLLRDGEHKSMFDKQAILDKVKLAGFKKVSATVFDPASDRNPRFSSIYVEALK